MGCPGSWHHGYHLSETQRVLWLPWLPAVVTSRFRKARGHWHHSHHAVVIHEEHVGHGGYDCHAGASNWMQGWWLGTDGQKKVVLWLCPVGYAPKSDH